MTLSTLKEKSHHPFIQNPGNDTFNIACENLQISEQVKVVIRGMGTRVSSKEQMDTNQSLEWQKKYCDEYAIKNKFNIKGYFGGTYESAKSDERKEFNRMLKFV